MKPERQPPQRYEPLNDKANIVSRDGYRGGGSK